MKNVNQKTLGLNILVKGVPTSASEFDEMAGEVGACVDEAVNNVMYRSWLAKFRSALVTALAKETGIEPLSEGEGDNKKVIERDTIYVKRLRDVEGVELAVLQTVAQKVADELPFTVGQSASGRIAKRFLEMAEELMGKVEQEYDGDYSRFVENITSRNPGFAFVFDDSGAPTQESIAFALKQEEERAKRENQNTLLG